MGKVYSYKIKKSMLPFRFDGKWYWLKKKLETYEFVVEDGKPPYDKLVSVEILNKLQIVCTKTLYKSTYNGNAFTKKKHYYIMDEYKHNNNVYFSILDNKSQLFNIVIKENGHSYVFNDYFSFCLY